ncbi:MAG: penicillin-binding transpeptidase domain-containing protein [Phycisphaerales bacterium]
MFLRRLMLLGGLFCAAVTVLAVQGYRLTVLQGDQHTEVAESRLLNEKWTPTIRGRILDRKGRVLALDKPGFDVMVSYPVITGEWAYEQAWRDARKANRPAWPKMTAAQRDETARRLLPPYEQKLAETWARLARSLAVPPEELAETRNRIIAKVHRTVSTTKQRWLDQRIEKFGPLNDRGEAMSIRDVDRPVAVEREMYPVAAGASEDKLFELRRIEADLPGVQVIESAVRVYPYETMLVTMDRSHYPEPIRRDLDDQFAVQVKGVGTHILGWMRGIRAEDVDAQPRKDPVTGAANRARYFERDKVGAGGVEESMEKNLRGKRGVRREHLDTGELEHEPAETGADVNLTIDVNLQSRVQAIMSPESGLGSLQPWHLSPIEDQKAKIPLGTPLNGAAVVLDIESGEILAAVSMPTFTRDQVQDEPDTIFKDVVNTAYVNRVVAKPYPPGSIVKPIILASAVSQGVHSLGHFIDCTGHLYPNQPTAYRCWIFKQNHGDTHASYFNGPLNPVQALAASCNIYFFTLGRALGVDGIRTWYSAFGVGTPFNLGIGQEWPGSILKKLPGPGGKIEPPQLQDAIFMGIGQGPIDWTPLHAADAYATIARGGTRIVPRILKDAPVKATSLRLDAAACDASLDGLFAAANDMDYGTGSRLNIDGLKLPMFNHPDLDVRGKTGTAAAPRIFADIDDDGDKEIAREGDHSWYLVLVGPKGKSPKYAIGAVMEYAGSGGRVSGPIVNQIIWALKAEGYL